MTGRGVRWFGPGALALALLLVLGGCATADKTADDPRIDRVNRLQSEGFWEAAIDELSAAARETEPNHRYRAALLDVRSRARIQLLRDAEALRLAGRHDDARKVLERLLRIEPGELRAKSELQQIETDRRHVGLIEQAEALVKKGDLVAAEVLLKQVLVESPRHARAATLLRRVEERRMQATAPVLSSPALKQPVSMEFREANLKMVLDILAKASGINFVLDKDIRADAKASILVRNAPVEEAIESLLTTNQLGKKILSPNSVLVYPRTAQKIKDYEDLVIRNFFLSSADAKQMSTLLKTILKMRDVYLDEKRNLIVVRDTPEAIRLAERLISAHDQAEPEVMLEVEVLEVSRTKSSEVGIELPNRIGFGVVDPITLRALREASSANVNVTGLGTVLGINLRKIFTDSNLLANPRIRVRNREKAKIHVGDRVPVISSSTSTTTGISAQSVNYLDVGLKLEVEPQVLDDDVVMKVNLEVSSLGREITVQNSIAFQVGTRTASTTLTLRDGETQVLAGLINDNDRETARRVPGIDRLPVLGRLFSSDRGDAEKTEIILSITPRIVRRLERPEAALAEFWSGPETSVRSALSSSPAPSPAAPGPAPAPSRPAAGLSGSRGVAPAAVAPPPAAAPAAPQAQPAAPTPVPGQAPGAPAPLFFRPPPGVGTQ